MDRFRAVPKVISEKKFPHLSISGANLQLIADVAKINLFTS